MQTIQQINWDEVRYFKRREFVEPDAISPRLLRMLDEMRHYYGKRITITGSCREKPRGKQRTSAHEKNKYGRWEGVDIRARTSRNRYELVAAAYAAGFNRIGVYTKHIHVDIATEPQFPDDVLWPGVSA